MVDTKELVYLDNAATTHPKPECVYQAADEFYRRYGGNAGRGANPLARKGAELIADTRAILAEWLGAPSSEQVIFAPSATIALNLVILGTKLRYSDTAYITPFEHNSVLRPVEHLRQSIGIFVQEIPFDHATMACQLDQLAALFQNEPPSLVCVTQASNVCGVMSPVTEIALLAKRSNPDATVVVDGAQVAGLHQLPLKDGLVDAYVFSGHKSLYGPYGVAGVVLAADWRPTPLLFGGTGTASESVSMPSTLPSAYEAGSHNTHAIAGLRAALEWLRGIGREACMAHVRATATRLRDALNRIDGLTLYTPDDDNLWAGIVSFSLADYSPQATETLLSARQIAVRAGLHCAPLAHRWLGTMDGGGTVRASVSFFNSQKDVELLAGVLAELCSRSS